MKRGRISPDHNVLELVTAHFEVNTEVVHNRDVISKLPGRREMREPTTLLTFRKVYPPARWGRCSHRSRVILRAGRRATEVGDGGGSRMWGNLGSIHPVYVGKEK